MGCGEPRITLSNGLFVLLARIHNLVLYRSQTVHRRCSLQEPEKGARKGVREEFVNKDKVLHFEQLKPFISGSKGAEACEAAADALGISEGAVKVAAHRLRGRYRDLLRSEIAQTVEEPKEIDDEIRSLFAVLGEKD